MLNFRVNCGNNGYQAAITQYYYGVSSASYAVRKYTPTSHSYTTIPGASYSPVTIGGMGAVKVMYSITDGSSLDDDGSANGNIDDPAGLDNWWSRRRTPGIRVRQLFCRYLYFSLGSSWLWL